MRHDGTVVHAGFRLDLEQLRGMFETVNDFGWNTMSFSDPDGPYVYVEGVIWGHEVFLQVLASPPEDEEQGPSKYPPAFGIDLHVDDSEGVAEEGKLHRFEVVVVSPYDEDWVARVLKAIQRRPTRTIG